MSSDPIDAMCHRGRFARSDLPAFVDELTPDEATRLAELFHRAVDRRKDELEESIDEGLTLVPRPLRGPVKKILGV